MALPLALVTVVVLALTFSAIAGFEGATVRSQSALSDKADVDLAADSAIDSVITAVELDTDAGVYQMAAPTPGSDQACSQYGSEFTYPDESLGADVTVECFADPTSVPPDIVAGEPPPFVIRTVGGMAGQGDVEGGSDTEAPFCDDFQGSSATCEAGVFVGVGVNADPGGLVVAPNDPGATGPLIESNGSIISRRGATQRTLNVQGDVAARRACPDVVATGDTACDNPGTWFDVPDWRHELWNQTVDGIRRPKESWDTYDPYPTDGYPAGNGSCADGLAIFQPGWYDSLQDLNTWTSACPAGTTFWFAPGTYYFDFVDVGAATKPFWEEPVNFAQFVGGTPQGWNPCSPCAQPAKVMRAEDVTASSAWATPAGASTIGDGSQAKLEFPGASGGTTRTITYRKPRTALPLANTVGKVTLRVSEQHDNLASLYATPPTVTVNIDGVSGSCVISLLADPAAQEFELPGDCTTRTGSFPATASAWNAHPEWVNALQATFSVRRNGAATPNVLVDGIELEVEHTGAPAPDFPRGCERGKPGVQFVFGNLSRMKFKGNDVYMELCGSRGQADERALTVYGLTRETTPAPLARSSGQVGGTNDWTAELLQSTNIASGIGVLPAGNGLVGQPQEWEQIGDGRAVWTDPLWVGTTDATLSFTLPTDFVPANSTIEAVRCRLSHAEPKINAALPNNVTTINVSVEKPLGSTADPSDPDSTATNGACPFFKYQPNGVYMPAAPGQYAGPFRTDVSDDSSLSPNLRTSNALNGATVTLTVSGNAGAKGSIIEGLEIEVEYRPPGTLRPLRGCMTTRLGYSAATSNLADFRGISPIHNWGPYVTSTDNAFVDDTGEKDVYACALMNVQSDSSGLGTRLHISGTVFAPTAALQFTGNDNNTSLVTDGVLARHISVLRYRDDGDGIGFGGGSGIERTRTVIVQVSSQGVCVAEAKVEFENTDSDPRDEARIVSWERRPDQCTPN